MRTIIAGCRNHEGYKACFDVMLAIKQAAKEGIVPSVVLCGCANGIDTIGESWAEWCGVPVEKYPAQWLTQGKKAGILRNIEMGDRADALIALWDGESRGTRHMIEYARSKKLRVFVYKIGRNHE